MRRVLRSARTAGLAIAVLVSGVALSGTGRGAEIVFTVQEGESRATWSPAEVVIHRETELRDGLAFVLENPSGRSHAFAAHGLFQQTTGDNGEPVLKPLRVPVLADDSVHVQVSTAQFEGAPSEEAVEEFRFFCPYHKRHLGGTIRVVP